MWKHCCYSTLLYLSSARRCSSCSNIASVRLACGALIVGSAQELGDLREDIGKVGTCSQELQASQVQKECVSTCLAVGNQLNKGTARSSATGIVLPESLLKLDELKRLRRAAQVQIIQHWTSLFMHLSWKLAGRMLRD
mmetsp:Transcript_18060/g.32750  ORF Transcript_18060/g.32750 Transcript_18060/m.32750 type:complete len:138 (+) Transcript_18060:178-591(+)